ncbi:26S protease regulatory subunit S10B [Artemisia annua]|uniref:26S protease regulatory subunit S10B n=1 Tax=Artemisia annua TaxID=35608 RepID=A0A2U1L066_ARTAN|nr:26S protease regulatory subunit S10B [Artemisia annua]
MATKDEDMARRKAIAEYLEKKRQHELLSLQVRGVREARSKKKDYAKTKDDLKSLQSVGQNSGEVPRPQGNKPCKEAPRSKKKDYAKTKDDLKSVQSVGQSTGEVLRPQGNKPCK